MLQTEIKRVLSVAIQDDHDGSLDRALTAVPLVLRYWVTRRIGKIVSQLWLDHASVTSADDHIYRLAWLHVAQITVVDPNDITTVRSLYLESNRHLPPQPFWVRHANLGVVIVALAIASGALAWNLLRERPPLETPEGQAFGQLLPDYVICVNEWADAKRNDRIAQLDGLRSKVDTSRTVLVDSPDLPESVRGALGALMDANEVLLTGDNLANQDVFHEALRTLNRTLLDHDLPYFVDAEIISSTPENPLAILSSYHVIEKRRANADASSVLALHVKRLDNLNFRQDYLGFTRRHIDVALVLYDNLEDIIVNFVAPALGENRPMPLLDMESREFDQPWQDQLLQRAGEIARAELHLPDDAEHVRQLGNLFADRHDLVLRWQVELERKRIILPDPETYAVVPSWLESIETILPNMEVSKLRDIERALQDSSLKTTFERIKAPLIESVERHEVQHRLDYEHHDDTFVPAAVRELYGLTDTDAPVPQNARRVTAELSAYVAELAYDDKTTLLNLTILSRLLFHRTMWGTAESQVALIVFQSLPEKVGLATTGPLTYHGRVHREKLSEIYLQLVDIDRAILRKAARSLWEEQFGQPLPTQITVASMVDE